MIEEWGEDIRCLRLPMPEFGGVNALLIGKQGVHAIIDAGLPNAETLAVWKAIDSKWVTGAQQVLGTHMHIDHVGHARFLLEQSGEELLMSTVEHQDVARVTALTQDERLIGLQALWKRHGFDERQAKLPSNYSVMAPFPAEYRRLEDGDQIELGGIAFEVMLGGGHSLAPVCLFSDERKLFVAGDQILSGSGPQIVVPSNNPDYDALGAYFEFLDSAARLPADTTVLPGHGDPLELGHAIDRIRHGHLKRLERVVESVSDWMTCAQMVPLAFSDRALERLSTRMPHMMPAIGNYLVNRGKLARRIGDAGEVLFGPV